MLGTQVNPPQGVGIDLLPYVCLSSPVPRQVFFTSLLDPFTLLYGCLIHVMARLIQFPFFCHVHTFHTSQRHRTCSIDATP